MSERPTPITDAAKELFCPGRFFVFSEVSENLERQLAEANEKIQGLQDGIEYATNALMREKALAGIQPPPCDNCGQPARFVGSHPEAGHSYVCNGCWRGHGFENLKPWDYWRKPAAPEQLEEFKRELDAKLAATTDEQLRAELEAVGCHFTPPAERPTPVTDAALCISHHPNDLLGWPEGRKAEFGGDHIVPARVCRDLERQLAEANEKIQGLQDGIEYATNALKRIAECEDAPDIDIGGEAQFGLRCGVEDQSCIDRYEGADYGYSRGVKAALEWAVNEAKHALDSLPNDKDLARLALDSE